MKKIIFALAAIISLAACSNDHYEKGTLAIEQWRNDGSLRRDTIIDNVWTDVCMGDILFTKDTVEDGGFYKLEVGDSLFVAPGPIRIPYPRHSVKRIK